MNPSNCDSQAATIQIRNFNKSQARVSSKVEVVEDMDLDEDEVQ